MRKNIPENYSYVYPALSERKESSHYAIQSNKTYAVRASRTTDAQKKAYNRGMQDYGMSSPFLNADSLQKKISMRKKQSYTTCVLDIGFGNGSTLYNASTAFLDTLFIGIEVYAAGIGALLKEVLTHTVENILIYHDDAIKVLYNEVENESIDAIHVFFPDPWHKTKHNKRRMVNKQFMLLVYQLLLPRNGIFWFISDNPEYVQEVRTIAHAINTAYAQTHGIQWTMLDYDANKERLYSGEKQTKFEQRAHRLGNPVQSLVLQRV